jgi:hypothetical protein
MFTLDAVVPWGRSFDEYCAMFALSDRDLGLRILDCGGGPASFNAEGTRGGRCIVSCDPIYRFTASQIETRIAATYAAIIDQTRHNASEFVWTSMRSVDELGAVRMAAMRKFLDDYPAGLVEGRYRNGELPTLPFADRSFDLAVSSHLLFLYTEQFDESFHCSSIAEMGVWRTKSAFFRCSLWGRCLHVMWIQSPLTCAGAALLCRSRTCHMNFRKVVIR